MKLFSFLFVTTTALTLLSHAAAVSPFAGTWLIQEIYDESMEQKSLPDGQYTFAISQAEDEEHLRLGIRVGNSMSSHITLLEEAEEESSSPSTIKQSVQVGGMMSTMMMPPDELFKLEVLLSDIVPQTKTMVLENENHTLTFLGEAGKIVCTSQED